VAHAIEHIQKLKTSDAKQILKRGITEKLVLACTVGDIVRVFDLTLQGEIRDGQILLASKKWENLVGKDCAFSMKIETQVYFFKTKVQKENGEVFLKNDFEVFELVRRKEVRHKVPYEWPQSAALVLGTKRDKRLPANIIDLSKSGIRLQLLAQLPEFRIGQRVAFTIRIHRRAIAYVNGVVKHSKRVANQLPVVGIEFEDLTPLITDKVLNICNDIVRFHLLSAPHKKN